MPTRKRKPTPPRAVPPFVDEQPKKRILYPHQRQAVRYAIRTPHPALFMKMRLGKSLVALRTINTYKARNPRVGLRALIVGPSSTLGSADTTLDQAYASGWYAELMKEGVSPDDVALLVGRREKRERELARGCTWNLINPQGVVQTLPQLGDIPWDVVLLDESTFIKNARAGVTKWFMNHFRDVPHRWILTGTPNPEGCEDLFTQFAFLDDGATFGGTNFWSFRRTRFLELDFGGWVPKGGTRDWMLDRVAQSAFVMSLEDAGYFADRVYEQRRLEMPKWLQKVYRKAEDEFVLALPDEDPVPTQWATVRLNWLRQLCGGFALEEKVWSGKVDELVRIITEDLDGGPAVVWFAFNQELHASVEALHRAGLRSVGLVGKVSKRKRFAAVEQFQKGELDVLCVQVRLGRFSLALHRANTCIYFSSPYDMLSRSQSEDRVLSTHKLGTADVDPVPLLYLDLVVKGTVDESVLALCHTKARRSALFLQMVNDIKRRRRRK